MTGPTGTMSPTEAWAAGYRYRAEAARNAGLPATVPLACCGGRLELDYEQLTPFGMMPAAMEIHAGDCAAMADENGAQQ